MYLELVKKIASEVLYLDSPSELKDDQPLGDQGFSSIDYIDMCFEMKSQISDRIDPNNLWPFNEMATKQEYFDGTNWTDPGWCKVCDLLGLNEKQKKLLPAELVKFFTPQALSKRIEQIIKG